MSQTAKQSKPIFLFTCPNVIVITLGPNSHQVKNNTEANQNFSLHRYEKQQNPPKFITRFSNTISSQKNILLRRNTHESIHKIVVLKHTISQKI